MSTATTIQVQVQLYAQLREQAEAHEIDVTTSAATVSALYTELRARYGFRLEPQSLQAAVNHEFCNWQESIRNGDTVTFIPPVAGG